MKLGIDRFCSDAQLRSELSGKRVALLAHPASVTHSMVHTLDAIMALGDVQLVSAFGPQHGMRGDKQDNMVESQDFLDPCYKIPVFSLYGDVRRPTVRMLDTFDVILVDLQDLGCRIYTFVTTLLYILQECSKLGKAVWVLDRPNPVGRGVEGTLLQTGWESFVGSAEIPMRHGMTVGELGKWFIARFALNLDYRVVAMEDYRIDEGPGYGWPLGELNWVNPSPNAPNVSMARCYPGSVLLEGTTLSEGRGTTRPLELGGAPDIDMNQVLITMRKLAPEWLKGCRPRVCHFEPTFHKHSGKLCQGIQFHVDDPTYDHEAFKPYRIFALMLKAIRLLDPQYSIWRSFAYEYEKDRLAIDLINGSPLLREWVDDPRSQVGEFEAVLLRDEETWKKSRKPFLIYSS